MSASGHDVCGPDCTCGCPAGLTIPIRPAASERFAMFDARRVWAVLVTSAGADDTDSNWVSFRQWLDKAIADGQGEYRFIGSLGFGGKFWIGRSRWYVTCYPEDETPDRLAVIEDTNLRLASLREAALDD